MFTFILNIMRHVDWRLKWTHLLPHFIYSLIQREQDWQPRALEQSGSQLSVQGIGE